jgi:hypothetical protein
MTVNESKLMEDKTTPYKFINFTGAEVVFLDPGAWICTPYRKHKLA